MRDLSVDFDGLTLSDDRQLLLYTTRYHRRDNRCGNVLRFLRRFVTVVIRDWKGVLEVYFGVVTGVFFFLLFNLARTLFYVVSDGY